MELSDELRAKGGSVTMTAKGAEISKACLSGCAELVQRPSMQFVKEYLTRVEA